MVGHLHALWCPQRRAVIGLIGCPSGSSCFFQYSEPKVTIPCQSQYCHTGGRHDTKLEAAGGVGKPRPRELVSISSSGTTLHSISFNLSVSPAVKEWECQSQEARKQRKWNYQSQYKQRKAGRITELVAPSLSCEEVVASAHPSLRGVWWLLLLFSVSFVFVLSHLLLF